jgi:hypothetical protein
MRERAPFRSDDLAELDMRLLDQATAVVAMEDVHDGHRDPNSIGLRHDCDAGHSLATAVKIAEWEAERGYRSTFFILHTSPYWEAPGFCAALERICDLGHEIGIHNDALAEALTTGGDPDIILSEAIGVLRGYGFSIRGAVGHGNPLCNRDAAEGEGHFANDEQFTACRRTGYGDRTRTITRGDRSLTLHPRPLADFGLDYEALWCAHPYPFRISDSGGKWLNPGWEETVVKWQQERREYPTVTEPNKIIRQLHFLLHPDWWSEAFVPARLAA